jgi:hypothetical protein
MNIPKIIISYAADDLKLTQAMISDQPDEVRRVNQGFDRGAEIWASWCLVHGGDVVSKMGPLGIVTIAPEHLAELPDIQERYASAVDGMVAIGIGLTLRESRRALELAEHHGGSKVVFYTPEVDAELKEIEEPKDEIFPDADRIHKSEAELPLVKAQHPLQGQFEALVQAQDHAEGQKKLLEQEDAATSKAKTAVVQILQQVRANTEELETLRTEMPHLYESIMSMTQGLIMLAQRLRKPDVGQDQLPGGQGDSTDPKSVDQAQLAAGTKEETEEHSDNPSIGQEIALDHLTEDPKYYQKSESAPKAKHFVMNFPVGFQLPTGPGTNGPRGGGRIKVQTSDGKTRWRSVRASMVMSPDGSPTSSRNPSGSEGQ